MRALFVSIAILALLPLLFAACSDSDSKSTPTIVAGTPASDDAYMTVFCTGLSNLSSALVSKPTANEIATVMKAYITELKKITPPKDLEKFHAEYIKFFEDSVNDPTSVLTRKPPAPSETVRQHYADIEQKTPACKDARFFVQPS